MKILRFISIVSFALLSACSQSEVGSKARPFTMYFVPSVDSEQITTTAKSMKEYVEKSVSQSLYGQDRGFYVETAVPASYIAVVEAFGTKRADFAALNTFSYILAKDTKKYDVEVLYSVIRGEGEKTYKGQIITRSDSGINSMKDLEGKKFAYTDPASTSGYILPSDLIKKENVKLGETVFASKHDNVVTMVYQGQVDAGATYYSPPINGKIRDARERVLTQFPDAAEKIKIIGFTQDIPNDPWIIRTKLVEDPEQNEKMKSAIRTAILGYAETPVGLETLKTIYSISGISVASDDEYNPLREIMKTANINVEELMRK